jgi:hypothetical protein
MTLALTCDCGARFEIEDTLAGQEVICPDCEQKIQAPAAKQPTLRTNDFALLSTVLALVGAFTVLGTVAAVVVGVIALVQIGRHRDRYAGSGFALFGISAGLALTTLSVLAMGSRVLDLGARMRRNILADKVDTSGDLEYVDSKQGFRILRPSRQWGVSDVKKLEDPFVNILQGNNRNCDLLLVHTARTLYLDVRAEGPRERSELDAIMRGCHDELDSQVAEEFRPRERIKGDDDSSPFKIMKYQCDDRAGKSVPWKDGKSRESSSNVVIAGQRWKMLIRVFRDDERKRVFIVRAYGPVTQVKEAEAELKKLMDSFAIAEQK